jgi:hypothetical protein
MNHLVNGEAARQWRVTRQDGPQHPDNDPNNSGIYVATFLYYLSLGEYASPEIVWKASELREHHAKTLQKWRQRESDFMDMSSG